MFLRRVNGGCNLISLVPVLEDSMKIDPPIKDTAFAPTGDGSVIKRECARYDRAVLGDHAQIESYQWIVTAVPRKDKKLILPVIDRMLGRLVPIR
jgi:hypothetical protein